MKGLYSGVKKLISNTIDSLFNRVTQDILGVNPKEESKSISFRSLPKNSLANLFAESLDNPFPNHVEQDVLKNLLDTTSNYLDSLKLKTQANVTNAIDAYVKDQQMKGQQVSELEVQQKLLEGLLKAKSGVKLITEAETTKVRNMGKMLNIVRMASDKGIKDPYCYFVVVKDDITCEVCKKTHLMPDGITPKVFKLSELSAGYYVKKSYKPSYCGCHPHCVTGNMLLHTDKGLKSFKDLFEEKTLQTVLVDNRVVNKNTVNLFNKNGFNHFLATNVYDTGIQECLKITLKNKMSVEVSLGHEMWVFQNNTWNVLKALELKEKDIIPIFKSDYSEIETIENIGMQQTYCLTEPMTNTITVNGIVTRNCRCTLVMLPDSYGFKNGKSAYIGEGHIEYDAQRSEDDINE